MGADLKSIRFANTIRYFRWSVAFVLTPVFIFFWLGFSLGIVMARFGANPDGPARVMLGAFLLMVGLAVPSFCLLFLGLPHTLIMSMAGRLNFLAILLPTLPIAILYGLLVYSSLNPDRFPTQARTVAMLAAPGVLVAGLCFYVVAVWRNTPRRS